MTSTLKCAIIKNYQWNSSDKHTNAQVFHFYPQKNQRRYVSNYKLTFGTRLVLGLGSGSFFGILGGSADLSYRSSSQKERLF